jgi:hypothetical protein
MHERDVYLACQGKKVRITTEGNVTGFAVAQDGSHFIIIRERGQCCGERSLSPFARETYFLKDPSRPPTLVREDEEEALYASCGIILNFSDVQGQAVDLVTGQPLSFPPYTSFLCSSDRKTIVGRLGPDGRALWAGLPPSREIITVKGPECLDYDVSANGKFVAYNLHDEGKLCVQQGTESPHCVRYRPLTSEPASVADDGGVLFRTCVGSPVHPCDKTAVAYWHPGEKAPRELEFEGYAPQWLTPAAAAALLAWDSRQPASEKGQP